MPPPESCLSVRGPDPERRFLKCPPKRLTSRNFACPQGNGLRPVLFGPIRSSIGRNVLRAKFVRSGSLGERCGMGSEATSTSQTQRIHSGPLAGIRVVEFAQNVAIPTCGALLGAMGAEVIKIEPPGGDSMRVLSGFAGTTEGRGYVAANPGKKSVILDLGDPAVGPVKDALIRSADVVLTAFKAPDLTRYGLSYEHAKSLNPTLIYLELNPLGSVGPDAQEGGYDVLVQGISGLSFITSRSEGGRPLTARPAYSDMGTGLTSTAAVLAALYHRSQTGEGQRVRTSLLGTAYYLATPMVMRFNDYDGEALTELREDLATLRSVGATFDEQRELYESRVPAAAGAFSLWFRHYLTADGLISIGALSPGLMSKFHVVTGLPDPRVEKWPFGSVEFSNVVQRAEALLASNTTEHWLTRFRAAQVPCSRFNTPDEALDDPGALANGFVQDLDHSVLGTYRTVAPPIVMDRTPLKTQGPSPTLGEHTNQVLTELGF